MGHCTSCQSRFVYTEALERKYHNSFPKFLVELLSYITKLSGQALQPALSFSLDTDSTDIKCTYSCGFHVRSQLC
jgi:hypothetical protein